MLGRVELSRGSQSNIHKQFIDSYFEARLNTLRNLREKSHHCLNRSCTSRRRFLINLNTQILREPKRDFLQKLERSLKNKADRGSTLLTIEAQEWNWRITKLVERKCEKCWLVSRERKSFTCEKTAGSIKWRRSAVLSCASFLVLCLLWNLMLQIFGWEETASTLDSDKRWLNGSVNNHNTDDAICWFWLSLRFI